MSKLERQEAFLRAVSMVGSVREAAQIVGISPETHWVDWLQEKDSDYRERFEEHRKRFIDVLEQEAYRRAVVGYDEEKRVMGVLVEATRKRSDQVLMMMLKANARDKYGDKVETNNTNKNLNLDTPVDFTKLTDAELADITKLATAFGAGDATPGAASEGGASQPPAP